MKSITLAVVFAGLVSYGTMYSPPAVPPPSQAHEIFATDLPPLIGDPDDDEEDRISHHRTKHNRRFKK